MGGHDHKILVRLLVKLKLYNLFIVYLSVLLEYLYIAKL